MAKRRTIPDFHLRVSTLRSSGKLLVQLIEAPDHKRSVEPCDVESPLKRTYKSEKALGRALYECLFYDERVRHRFETCRAEYSTDKAEDRVRLRLVVEIQTSPDRVEPLLNLPWELLHDERGWLVRDPTLSIVRRLNVKRQDVQEDIHPPLRILLACAEPRDKSLFGAERALKAIHKVIKSVVRPPWLEDLPHTTKRNLEPLIRQGFHIVHFLGHGDVEAEKAQLGMLFLELEESPFSDILTATELVSWIEEAAVRPRLFVLTACHSGNPTGLGFLGVATALLDAGVEAVVAMQMEIYPDEAEAFAEAFYRALGDRLAVDDAVQAGRQALNSYSRIRSVEASVARLLIISDDRRDAPTVQWYLGTVGGFDRPENAKSIIAFPGWAVPTLFLQGDGWLGQGPPEALIVWTQDQKEMVHIQEGNFYIDKYPVTRREYRGFASDTGRSVPWREEADPEVLLKRFSERLPKDAIWDSERVESLLPATNVRLRDTLAYAAWAGKHIPTPHEWRRSALSGCSDKEWRYPWGEEFLVGRCNTRESKHRQLWPVVLSEACNGCNPAGVCDVVGNVAEWTQADDGQGFLCGGSFKDSAEECSVQSRTPVGSPYYTNSGVGFRCAATWSELMEQPTGSGKPDRED